MHRLWRTCFALCVVVSSLGVSQASHDSVELDLDALTAEQMRNIHNRMDLNSDGKVSMTEILAFSDHMRKAIAKTDIHTITGELDANKDGKVDLEELLSDIGQMGGHEPDDGDHREIQARTDLETAKFKVADHNVDGFLDFEELPSLFFPETNDGVLELIAEASFKQKDIDADGKLSVDEFWEGDGGEDLLISADERAEFDKLDADRSGALDVKELKHWESGRYHIELAMQKLFDIADINGDMLVTAEEFEKTREEITGNDAEYQLMEWVKHHEL